SGELRLFGEPGEKRVHALASGHDRHSRTTSPARPVPPPGRVRRGVRITCMLAALLLTVVPTVTDEVVWRTITPQATYRPAPPAAPVAVDGNDFLVTWSEVADGLSRAYAGRLDARGRLISVDVHTDGAADAASAVPFGCL